jgi:putative glutamine amidotransferase
LSVEGAAILQTVGLTFGFDTKAAPYRAALQAVGLEVADIEPGRPRGLEGLAGLVVSGGNDIDPARYGATAHAETWEMHPERDALESELLHEALRLDLPVLAICRGLQMLNVVCGGRLIQHLETAIPHRQKSVPDRSAAIHEVSIEAGSRLGALFSPVYAVNSRHHQAADPAHLGAGLRVTATAPDGVIEGLEAPQARFVVAVQWHPEDSLERDRPLFAAFAAAITATRESPAQRRL